MCTRKLLTRRFVNGLSCVLLTLGSLSVADSAESFPLRAKRILFLGDSITHAGHYVAWIDAQLRLHGVSPRPELINLGLPSETCTGLSEPQHPFPRPNVHERVGRALEKVQADVVVVCYGMNDGIYYPFGEQRFAAYQAGLRDLIAKVKKSGAKCIVMTPPPFDPEPLRNKPGKLLPADAEQYAYFAIYEGYDDVLNRYGKWIQKELPDEVEMVIDLHAPVTRALESGRKQDKAFHFAGDGVHLNAAGHRVMGETILKAWGVESTIEPSPELLKLLEQRTRVLHEAWLTHVGHKRPGGKPGPPLAEAQAKAAELDAQIERMVRQAR